MFRGRVRHVHFVGVGGVGMSGLAEILRSLEFDVSGSDMKDGSTTQRLRELGVRIDIGHRHENISGVDVVVYSSAIKPSNPELTEARALGIPVITRAEMLAELMRVKYGVAIAGSHGKTTTTSLIATVLRAAGLDPTGGGRRQDGGARLQRAPRGGRSLRGRSRRVGRLVPAPLADHRGDHQHRRRAPRSLRNRRIAAGRLRRVRRARPLLRSRRPLPRSPPRAGHPSSDSAQARDLRRLSAVRLFGARHPIPRPHHQLQRLPAWRAARRILGEDARRAQRPQLPRDHRRRRRARGPARRDQAVARHLRRCCAALHGHRRPSAA